MSEIINHVVFVLDESGSMSALGNSVVEVFDGQIGRIAARSTEMDQETRVSVFTFNSSSGVRCLFYDKDVLRLPSLAGMYSPHGGTPLIDATMQMLDDIGETPEKYGDHAFLVYVVTDGQETDNPGAATRLKKKIMDLPDNWTVTALVPDQSSVHEAKQYGFPADNIAVWNARSARGMEEAGRRIFETVTVFMVNRSKGVRGTKSLFRVDTANLSRTAVKKVLDKVNPSSYDLFDVPKEASIKDFVIRKTGSFTKGSAYYQLTKRVLVQGYKEIFVYDRKADAVYGGAQARQLLGLPMEDANVEPGDFGDYNIFIQSTSYTRKLMAGTKLLVMKNP